MGSYSAVNAKKTSKTDLIKGINKGQIYGRVEIQKYSEKTKNKQTNKKIELQKRYSEKTTFPTVIR